MDRDRHTVYTNVYSTELKYTVYKMYTRARRRGRLYKGVTYVQLGQGWAWRYKEKECGCRKCKVKEEWGREG